MMETPSFKRWMDEIFPAIKVTFATVAAKSAWFIDEKGIRQESCEADQSMFSHVFNAVSTIHQIVNATGLRDRGMVSEQDEYIAYVATTFHDMHKFVKDVKTGATFGHQIDGTTFKQFVDGFGFAVPEIDRVKGLIDMHHPKTGFVPDYKHPERGVAFKKDPAYHLMLLGDHVSGAATVGDAIRAMERSLSDLVANVESCKGVRWHFATHQTGPFDGDWVASLHVAAESAMSTDGWEPLLFFPDGTIYHSRDLAKAVDEQRMLDAISTTVNDMVSGDIIQIVVQKNKIKIKTKEYEKKAPPRKIVAMIVAELKFPGLVDKKFGQLQSDLDDKSLEDPPWGSAFSAIGYDVYANAAFLLLTGVIDIIRAFDLVPGYDSLGFRDRNARLCELLTGAADPTLLDRMDVTKIVDSSGSPNNASMTPGHLFPLAKAIRDSIYTPGMSMADFIDRLHGTIRSRLEAPDPVMFNGTGDVMGEKVASIIAGEIGFDRPPAPPVSDDFGFSAYANALDKLPGRFSTKCFLCGSTDALEEVGPDLVRMGLQQHSDRVPNGKGINAGTIKRICGKCMVKNTIRNKKHDWISKDEAEKTFYLTVLPNHVFTRDYDLWFGRYIKGLFSIGKEQFKKYVRGIKNESEDVPAITEKEVKLYTFIVKSIVSDLVYHASETNCLDKMHDLLHGTVERVVDISRFKEELGDDGIEDYTSAKDELITSKYLQHNGFVIPFKFIDENVNQSSMWLVAGILAMTISIITGARVTITQDYGNIPMIESRAAVTLDGPAPKAASVIGSGIELAGNDIVNKFKTAVGIYYINDTAISPGESRENTIPGVITTWTESPAKLVDLCYRYSNKATAPSKAEFYRIFSVIKAIT